MSDSASVLALRRRLTIQGIFLLLGVGILVPWNAFISAKDYFLHRICSSFNIESTFAMVYNLASVISLGLIIAIQGLRDYLAVTSTDTSHDNNNNNDNEETNGASHDHSFWLVMAPLSLYLASFLGQSLMVLIVHIPAFLEWTILSLAVCGMSSGIAQAGIVATAGLFEADLAMEPFLAGQSVGGVVVSGLNFVAAFWEDPAAYRDAHCKDDGYNGDIPELLRAERLLEDDSSSCSSYDQIDWAVFLYFFLGSALVFACLIGYSYIGRLRHSANRDEYETVHGIDGLLDASPRIGLELRSELRAQEESVEQETGGPPPLNFDSSADEPDSLFNEDNPNNETAAVWRHVKGPAVCIFLTFVVTLALFPGWTSELRSVYQCKTRFRLFNDLYTPFSFLLFNVGDLTGRLLLARLPIKRIRNLSTKLVIASCLRLLFFPLLFLCTGGSDANRTHIHSDLYSLTIQFTFAVTNGLLLTAAFVHAPTLVPNTTQMQERMSEILTFAVAFGLLCGSLVSFAVLKLVSDE